MHRRHGGSTAIGVHDDFAAGQTRIAIRSTDDEFARRVNIPLAIIGDLQVTQRFADIGFDNFANLLQIPAGIEMLRGQNDGYGFRSLAVDVTNRHGSWRRDRVSQLRLRRFYGRSRAAAEYGGNNRSEPASGPAFPCRRNRT